MVVVKIEMCLINKIGQMINLKTLLNLTRFCFSTTWVILEIMLSEISQSPEDKYCMTPFTQGS